MSRARRSGQILGCIILDVDHFKSINDRYGHLAGDEVLKDLGSLLEQAVRTYDVVGRYGGEEFVVLLPNTPMDEMNILAERIRSTVEHNIHVGSDLEKIPVTISLGITVLQASDTTTDDLVKRADAALYKAKENGRNRVETGPT